MSRPGSNAAPAVAPDAAAGCAVDDAEIAGWLRAAAPGAQAAIRVDSRAVRPGDVFAALPGAHTDGRRYLAEACARGATALLVEGGAGTGLPDGVTVPARVVAGLGARLGGIAAAFFGHPSRALLAVGVTGTNGKTSSTHFIAQALGVLGCRCAVIGTLGSGVPGEAFEPAALTTPDAADLQRRVRAALDGGAQALALEASSIGLHQARLAGMHFAIAVFTNLSRDHLDYHGTMADYEAAKARLFDWPGLAHAVINLDDPAGRRLAQRAAARGVAVTGTTAAPPGPDPLPVPTLLAARAVRATATGIAFEAVLGGAGRSAATVAVEAPLAGQFNVANLLGVLGVLLAAGHPLPAAAAALAGLVPPAGRMQRAGPGEREPLVVVDYAHTPDAIAQALAALRPLAVARGGRLAIVLGAGGDRDPGKRAPMGAAAATGADRVYVTSDNPRSEDPAAIVAAVAAGARDAGAEPQLEVDRARAIAAAVAAAGAADVVLVAGKGHEDYQEIAGARRPFSDLAQATAALAAWRRGR